MVRATRGSSVRTLLSAWLISMLLVGSTASGILLPRVAFAQSVSIPNLALWATHMVTYGQANCATLADPSVPFSQKLNSQSGDVYYDAERVFYQIADYAGNIAYWNSCAQVAESIFRDQYVIPNNGSVYGHWNFTTGLRMDYQRTGDTQSKYAAILLSQNAAFARDGTPLDYTTSADYSREVAYAIVSYINAQILGEPLRQRRIDLVNQAYDHMAQWFVRFAWPGPWQQSPTETSRLAPFMVGLTAHALIRDWEETKDSRLLPILRLAADWMWQNAWIPSASSMWYDSGSMGAGAPDLNLLVAPIYAFLYLRTGETKYRDEGDALFAGGVSFAYLTGGKQFDQNYWWSFDYVTWRTAAAGPADTTPPTVALTAPVSGSSVSGASVTVSASASDNVGVAGVQFKLDGANLGAEDTTAPYAISWNTTAANGAHTLTAVARDAAGNRTTSAPVSVTVNNPVDTTPPLISSVALSSVTSSGASISWTTNEPSDSQVEYGPTASYGGVTPLDGGMVTAHVVTLSGLAQAALYHYRVKSRDAAGNLAVSSDFTFTTLAPDITSALLGYWKLDDGSGVTAADSSGNGNTGSLVNGPTWTTGKVGGGLTLDGVSQYVAVPSTAPLNAYPLTVGAWIKTSSTSGVRGIVNKYVPFSSNGWGVFFSNGNLCAWYFKDSANYVYPGGGCPFNLAGYNDGQWHHVAFVVDAGGGHLYVDAVLKASVAWTGTPGAPSTAQPASLGVYPGGGADVPGGPGAGEYFPGSLDEVRIYARALSADEILIIDVPGAPSVDTTPPAVSITAPTTGTTVSGTVSVAAAASDDVGVAGVQLKLDGANLGAELTGSPYTFAWNTTAVPNGTHSLTAVARDAAGNTATAGVQVTVANSDTTPPTVSVTAPISGATVSGTITVSANAADNIGVAGVQLKLDGANLGAELTGSPYTFAWNTTAAPNGTYSLTAVARDAAGNTATAGVQVTVANSDTTPPTVSVTAPISGGTVSGTITVSASAADNVGIAGVQFTLDGANLGPEQTIAPFSIAWDSTTVPNGAHTVTATARDTSGNTTVSNPITFTVNNTVALPTPPVISSVGTSNISASSATITWATDIVSDSQVEYGLTTAYGTVTLLDPTLVTAHSEALSGLTTGSVYHYRVKSENAAANPATSGDFTLTTAAAPSTTPGLVAYWPLDSGTGLVATDASGNGHTGTLLNGPTWTAGKIGSALAFDGVTNYVEVPSAADLNAYPFTVATWFKTTSATGVRGIVNKYVPYSSNGWGLFLNNGNLCAWYYKAPANYVYPGGGCPFNLRGYNDGQWHHVAFVVDATGGTLYVDGRLKGKIGWTGTPGAPTTIQPVDLGRYPGAYGGAEYFSGSLDDVRIYNRALTISEVKALSGAGVAALWPLDDGTGLVATDASDNGHAGALLNGPTWTTDVLGPALAFDGVTNYVEVPSAPDLNAYPFTVATWFKTTSATGVRGIVNKYVPYSSNGWGLFLNDGNLCAWYFKDSANSVYPGGGCPFNLPGYNDGQWHHVAFVVDATGGTLYVDGSAHGSIPWTGTPGAPTTTQPVHLGRYPGGGADSPGGAGIGEYFPGILDGVQIYSRALGSVEVLTLHDSGLAALWPLADGTGLIATDASDNGHTGTLLNGPTWTTDTLGPALAFDGVTNYVQVPSTPDLSAYPFTVAAWFKTTSASGVRGIVNKYIPLSMNGWGLFLNNGNLCAWYYKDWANYVYPGGGCPFNLPGYNDGQWHHVAFVVDATGGTLYVDGAQHGSIPWTGTPGASTSIQPVYLGRYPGAYGGAEYFAGLLEDVRIYTRALSSAEVLTVYTVGPVAAGP